MPAPKSYPATVVRVLDGDTVGVDSLLCDDPHLTLRQHVRLFGCNAPEIHSKDADEKARGLAAFAFLADLLRPGVVVALTPEGHDKYGRALCSLVMVDGRDAATVMIASGHALPWDGHGPKPI